MLIALILVDVPTALAAAQLTFTIGALRWMGEKATVTIVAKLGEEEQAKEVSLARGEKIHASFSFDGINATEFSIAATVNDKSVFVVEGILHHGSIRITRAFYDDKLLAVAEDETLIEVVFIGRIYSVEVFLPIKGDLKVECTIDGAPAEAKVKETAHGLVIALENIVLFSERSSFTMTVYRGEELVSSITGEISKDGLQGISIAGGMVERMEARTVVIAGNKRAVIPSTILKSISATEVLKVEKRTEVVVSSEEVVYGNVPVKLLALRKGSWLQPPTIVPDAVFEVSIPSLNITKVYSNNSTAYLPAGEAVLVRVRAEGYIPREERVEVGKVSEVVVVLEEASPSLLAQLESLIAYIVFSKWFVPSILGLIVLLLVVLLLRRR